MSSLAAALLVGLTAMAATVPTATAAVVPGAEGPAPRRAAPTSATTFDTSAAAAHRLTAEGATCDKVRVDRPSVSLSYDALYADMAEYGRHLVERFFEILRAARDTVDRLTPRLNALEASPAGRRPA